MRRSRPLRSLTSLVLGVAAFTATWAPASLAGQQQEPALAQVREIFSQPGLTLGFLLQAVVDPGIDDDPASVQVAAARIRVSGELDGGFSYQLQTNHAASPSLLDARVAWTYDERFTIHAGRFKTPFSRELLTYAGSIDFVNRSRVVAALAPNRQMGVQATGSLSDHVAYAVGGFTGGSNATPNEALAGVARLEGTALEVGAGTLSVAAHAAMGRDAAIATRALGAGYLGEGVLVGTDARWQSERLLLAAEFIRADWNPVAGADFDADGIYATLGWMLSEKQQGLLRFDRYRAPTGDDDDVIVLGYNLWPTSASEVQVNWTIPLKGSNELHKVLVNFQIGY